MDAELVGDHIAHPRGIGRLDGSRHRGTAGGAACGDLVEFRCEAASDGSSTDVGFDADGCGALVAASSVLVEMTTGRPLLDAATASTERVSAALGGLPASKVHAAELAVDAFHRALGSAATGTSIPRQEGRRLVAMSGGVDSAVAAELAARKGEVAGVTLELWRDDLGDSAASCCSHVAVRRARSLAHREGRPHFTLDLREEFRSGVVDPWLDGHSNGSTPNPCVECNGRVRIEPMVDLARRLGAEALVTGHYARLGEEDDPLGPVLMAGASPEKDQAYALARVPSRVLASMEFPLGDMTKPEVRELAARLDLPVADAPDSQDLCFLAGVGRSGFLSRVGGLTAEEGPIVSEDGVEIGTHAGHFNHTVGQRKGLGVGGGTPLYVLATDAVSNTVTVGPRRALGVTRVELEDVDLRRPAERIALARLRHRASPGRVAGVEVDGDRAVLEFAEPVARVARGQVACLLDGETVIGCGTVAACGA